MKGRYVLVGLLLLLLFTAAVSQRVNEEEPPYDLPLSFDIVVVGSGLPALTAALEATRQGAEVLLLDHPDLRDELIPPLGGRFVAFTGEEGEGNQLLLEAVKRASPGIQETLLAEILSAGRSTLDWISRETGLSFSFSLDDPHHSYSPSFLDPAALLNAVRASLLPRLASVVSGGEPLAIQVTLTGQVDGFRYRDAENREHTVTTRAVILAPGGYLGNPGFMEAHAGDLASFPLNARERGTRGQAYDLTRPIRARLANPDRVYLLPVLHPRGKPLAREDLPGLDRGRWFTPGGVELTVRTGSALAGGVEGLGSFMLSEGETLYVLFPAGQSGLSGLQYAGTPAQVVEYTGLPRDVLEELAPRFPPPYEVGRVDLELFYSLGGVATDEKGRVLGPMAAIPGLYALGEASGILHGQGIYPGLPLTEALVMGEKVGREAALFARR